MKTTTVRELRHHFGNVLTWVEEGERVEIRKRGHVVAFLTPPKPQKLRKVKWPDFSKRVKSYCGDFILRDEALAHILDENSGDR